MHGSVEGSEGVVGDEMQLMNEMKLKMDMTAENMKMMGGMLG